jgi:nitrate reductase alpha subunit
MAETERKNLQRTGEASPVSYVSEDDLYKQRWQWDRVVWGTHCVDCYPGNCPYRVYIKDGVVLHEEQAATYNTIEEGVPDFNPMGCQKGAMWGQMLSKSGSCTRSSESASVALAAGSESPGTTR